MYKNLLNKIRKIDKVSHIDSGGATRTKYAASSNTALSFSFSKEGVVISVDDVLLLFDEAFESATATVKSGALSVDDSVDGGIFIVES